MKMSNPTAIIFDWGNTLCDYPLRTEAEQIEFLHDFLTDSSSFTHLSTVTAPRSIASATLQALNREREDCRVISFADRFRSVLAPDIDDVDATLLELRLCKRLFATGQLMPQAEKVIATVRRMGYRTAILSNTPWGTSHRLWRAEVARHTNVSRDCDPVMFCGDCGYRKPSQAAFEACLSFLREAPDRVIMVGDSLRSDVLGARGAGCRAVWFCRDVSLPKEESVAVITTLYDIVALLEKSA
ncbi:HAD family hydrolase [Bradyrhizobium diversitatis]|uniref:HAD family hydrolase n=1 Tax=Bradyrhizobium diversitatis TaxID=2755406 RepID=A0ABS0NZH0_9BRAD|nr:HAD family hydrolase [Bradyrhizobium diversitatis]MBH5386413.1 HAD family hydrolase [Bradyrhizobium diversitatis]